MEEKNNPLCVNMALAASALLSDDRTRQREIYYGLLLLFQTVFDAGVAHATGVTR